MKVRNFSTPIQREIYMLRRDWQGSRSYTRAPLQDGNEQFRSRLPLGGKNMFNISRAKYNDRMIYKPNSTHLHKQTNRIC